MGSPIASLIADVLCMNWKLNEVSTFKLQPRVIFRYVNNLFCVFHGEDEFEQFLLKVIPFM